MKLSCPHCSQTLELTPDVLASLQGQPHFECPSCQGLIAVPAQPQRPMPRRPQPPASTAASQAQRGMNRNLLVLGVVALVVLGGIAAFLAARGGSITNIFQNTTNNIIHNNYFTQLIASGATTLEDLKSIEEIRPYGDGFIGISKEALPWSQAQALAKRTASGILAVEKGAGKELVEWLTSTYPTHLTPPVWAQDNGQPQLLDAVNILAGTNLEQPRKVLLQWFDPGPLVYEYSLAKPDTLEELYCFDGIYGGRALVVPGTGLELGRGWVAPMAWVRPAFGDTCRVQFEVRLSEKAWAGWTLKGAGHGTSPDSGYSFTIRSGTLIIKKEGVELVKTNLAEKMPPTRWAKVQTDVSSSRIGVFIDGNIIAQFQESEMLAGPSHGWFGLNAGNAIFRNLRVWSSAIDAKRERQFVPPVTEKVLANGKLLYQFTSKEGILETDWWKSQPEYMVFEERKLIFRAHSTNGTPFTLLTKPLNSQMACELEFEYPKNKSAYGFGVKLIFSEAAPEPLTGFEGAWSVGLDGKSSIYWVNPPTPGRPTGFRPAGSTTLLNSRAADNLNQNRVLLASTPYHSPICNKKYLARIENVGDSIRVFLDGGLLLAAKRPVGVKLSEVPVFLGLSQFYNDTIVHTVRVYEIDVSQPK